METTELAKIEPTECKLKIHGREREIKFGFSAWAKIQKKYGGVKNLDKIQKDMENEPFTTIPQLIYFGLVDKEGVTEEDVLDDYGLEDISMISAVLGKAMYGSLPMTDNKKKATTKK